MPSNLVAYIPVLNQRHLDWFKRHPDSRLYLISQERAEELIPRLSRNMAVVSTFLMSRMIRATETRDVLSRVDIFTSPFNFPSRSVTAVLPDEDVSRVFAGQYLRPAGVKFEFENIWARWDMSAVKQKQPVIPDFEISHRDVDIFRVMETHKLAGQSPDWWRQIGAMAFRGETILSCGWNMHYPTEYETDMFGDPRINFDAGDPAGSEVYVSLHAEKMMIARAARQGLSLNGASVYVNTFPCGDCARLLVECGISELFFFEGFSVMKGVETLQNAEVKIIQVTKGPEAA